MTPDPRTCAACGKTGGIRGITFPTCEACGAEVEHAEAAYRRGLEAAANRLTNELLAPEFAKVEARALDDLVLRIRALVAK